MKRILLILFLLTGTVYGNTFGKDGGVMPDQGTNIGGIGADGKFHFFLTSNAGVLTVTAVSTGAASMANGQVTTSTTAGTAVAARATRRSVTIKNIDSTITVYIGSATVTALNGMELKAGESKELETVALIQVIAASGTPKIAYIETYD